MAFLQNIFCNINNFDWNKARNVGRGSYGCCFSVPVKDSVYQNKDESRKDESSILILSDPPGTLYCAKVIQNGKPNVISEAKQQENLLREVLILKKVHHPAILDFKGFSFYDYQQKPNPIFITTYMPNGSLDKILLNEIKSKKEKLNVTKKQICLIGIASAMCYLHSMSIIHRDLKPGNILLDENFYPKVCDFGLSRALTSSSSNLSINIGTPAFMAPEILAMQPYSFPVDVYSYAMLAYQLVTGKLPTIKGANHYTIAQKVIKGERPSFDGCNVGEEFQALIKKCWDGNPTKRPNFETIYNSLVDDCTLLINDQVDRKELSNYIACLKENSPKGKEKLSICNIVYKQIDEGDKNQPVKPIIPEDENVQDEMLNQLLEKGISKIFTSQIRMALFSKMRSRLLNKSDYKSFIKITNYENSLAISGNDQASDFLFQTFKEVKFQNQSEINKRDLRDYSSKKLFTLNVSPTVKTIKEAAFKDKLIQYINLHSTIESIDRGAFMNCNKLVFINLTNRMTEITKSTFENCTNLAYVEFPSKLQHIRESAFKNCTSLTEIFIPESVINIEKYAFHGCKKLKTVHISRNTHYSQRNSFPMCATFITY